jgi:hypothetical protein
MPVRFLSDAELARLSGWPEEIADEDAVTFFTLTAEDLPGWQASTATTTGWASRCSCARCRGWGGYRTT